MQTITLSNYEVEVKETITWGEKQQVRLKMGSGAGGSTVTADSYIESQYVLLGFAIGSIKDKATNALIQFNRSWMDALPADDGDTLFAAVDKLIDGKK